MTDQNDRAGEYNNVKLADFCPDYDSSDSHSDNYRDCDSESVSLRFHLGFGFIMAQNNLAGEKKKTKDLSDSIDSGIDSDSDSDSW